MLRILLAVLCAFTGLPPVVASATATSSEHDNCCCSVMGHVDEHAGPRLIESPCGCGCNTPARTPDEFPAAPRDRNNSESNSLNGIQVEAALPMTPPRSVVRKLPVSPVPLRGPPDPAALCVWQE